MATKHSCLDPGVATVSLEFQQLRQSPGNSMHNEGWGKKEGGREREMDGRRGLGFDNGEKEIEEKEDKAQSLSTIHRTLQWLYRTETSSERN